MPRTGAIFAFTPSTVAPAVPGTPASATDFNAAMDDIAQALSDSMVTDAPTFTSPAVFDGGTEDAPGLTFVGDLDTGIWHPAANQVAVTVDGGATGTVLLAKTTGVDVTGDLAVSGDLAVTGDVTVTGKITESGRATLQESVSSTVFSHTGDTADTAVTGPTPDFTALSVTLTTMGRPVMVGLQPVGDAGAFGSYIGVTADAGGSRTMIVRIKRDGTEITESFLTAPASTLATWGHLMMMDVPTAAEHTYTVTIQLSNNAATASIYYLKLVAYEL